MKRLFYLFSAILLSVSISCSQNSNKKVSEMTFKEGTDHNFGTMEYMGDGSYEFVFKNTGKAPLIITNVKSSCGCTVPTYPKEPVKKKKEASIKVKYDTKRTGSFSKTVTVFSNAKNSPVILRIKGQVNPKKKISDNN